MADSKYAGLKELKNPKGKGPDSAPKGVPAAAVLPPRSASSPASAATPTSNSRPSCSRSKAWRKPGRPSSANTTGAIFPSCYRRCWISGTKANGRHDRTS